MFSAASAIIVVFVNRPRTVPPLTLSPRRSWNRCACGLGCATQAAVSRGAGRKPESPLPVPGRRGRHTFVLGDGRLTDHEAELEQLAVNVPLLQHS
jgi:hypothetical protein